MFPSYSALLLSVLINICCFSQSGETPIDFDELSRFYTFNEVKGKILTDTLNGQIVRIFPIDEKGQYMLEIFYLDGIIKVRGHYRSAKRKTRSTIFVATITSSVPVEKKFKYYKPKPDGWWIYYRIDGSIEKMEKRKD